MEFLVMLTCLGCVFSPAVHAGKHVAIFSTLPLLTLTFVWMGVPRERTVHAASKKNGWGKTGNSYDITGIKTLEFVPLPYLCQRENP